MPFIDDFLNKITMYRLVLYGLGILAAIAIVFGFTGLVAYSGIGMFLSLAILITVCYASNYLFALLFKASRSTESAYITAFILFFILAPIASTGDAGWIVAAGVIAMASKYLIAIKKKHIFNPAAVTAVLLSVAGSGMSIWWVGTPILFIPTLLIGLFFVRKIRRFDLFWSFIIPSILFTALYDISQGMPLWDGLMQHTLSWPTVFLATVMLTEPSTTPPARVMRATYGALVALLCSISFTIGPVFSSPALALVLGNIFSYIVSPKQRISLQLKSKRQLSANVYEFAFVPSSPLAFVPGQYMEWTLPHSKPDARGNRRYFTIASAPHEREIKLGVRMAPEPSSFKKALFNLHEGTVLSATSLSGEFTLPKDTATKLVFIAGGVGITPFASMFRHLISRGERRDIVLMYAASTEEDFAYRELLQEAKTHMHLKVVYVPKVFITKELVQKEIPDYKERMFYLSGPNAMVRTYHHLLRGMHIAAARIKTDYFPGL